MQKSFFLTLCLSLLLVHAIGIEANEAKPIELAIGKLDKAKDPLTLLTRAKLQRAELLKLGAPLISVNNGFVLPKGMFKFIAEKAKGHTLSIAEAGSGSRKLLICDDDSSGAVNGADTFNLKGNYVFAPLADYIAFKRKLMKVDSLDKGMLRLLEVEGEGKLSLSYKGKDSTEIEAAVLSSDGKVSWLSEGKGKMQYLPVGQYTLAYGLVYSRKLKKYVAGVLQGEMESLQVEKGGTNRTRLGKEFKLVFEKPVIQEQKLKISPRVKLYGRSGEEYVSYKWLVRPEIYYKKTKLGVFGFG